MVETLSQRTGARLVAACHNAAMGFDLVIRGATVVTPGHREAADIGIAGGRIAQLGGTMTGAEELAAGGLLAMPGGVDAHTHLVHQGLGDRLEFPVWVDDFWSGSRAAIAGGITTIGNMTYPVPDDEGTEETPSAAITREMAGAAPQAAVDWFLHPILLHPAALAAGEVGALAERGHASIKMFLSDPDLAADEPALLAAASAAKAAGSVTLLHCEDGAMLRQAAEKLIAEGRGAVANFPDARPVAAEVAAVDQAIGIARRTGARVYIVHLSSAAALDRCRRARAAGLPVYVETRPLYLHLTRERFAEPDAARYAGAPPLREPSDREALWAGLAAGEVDTVLQRPRAVDAGGQARPSAQRGDRPARSRRPRDADAHAVFGGRGRRPHLTRPVRGPDLSERRPHLRPVPAQGHDRRRLRRRHHAVGPRAPPHDRRRAHALAFRLFGVRRLAGPGLAEVRRPPRPARPRRRPDHRPPR